MSRVAETMTQWLSFPENTENFMFPSRTKDNHENENKRFSSIPADILDTPNEFIFYLDVPGWSKSDIQVTVENENTLVIKSGGKRKREEVEEKGVTKCENGVLTLVVEKLPPQPKTKTVEVAIS
ncbi:hypothetical protein DITRI_Ditri19aG0080100 [Diplodiscus trichospermus]